jgi:hypothetical protein
MASIRDRPTPSRLSSSAPCGVAASNLTAAGIRGVSFCQVRTIRRISSAPLWAKERNRSHGRRDLRACGGDADDDGLAPNRDGKLPAPGAFSRIRQALRRDFASERQCHAHCTKSGRAVPLLIVIKSFDQRLRCRSDLLAGLVSEGDRPGDHARFRSVLGCLLGRDSPHRRFEHMPVWFLSCGQSQRALHYRKTVGGQHQILCSGRNNGKFIVAQ